MTEIEVLEVVKSSKVRVVNLFKFIVTNVDVFDALAEEEIGKFGNVIMVYLYFSQFTHLRKDVP